MLFVLLDASVFARRMVHNARVGKTHDELFKVLGRGPKPRAQRHSAEIVAHENGPSLDVPQLGGAVVRAREHARAVVVEARAADGLAVTFVCSPALAVSHNVPDLDTPVHRRAQEQMPEHREQLDRRNAFPVPFPGMNAGLGHIARLVHGLQRRRRHNPRPPLIVEQLFAMERRCLGRLRSSTDCCRRRRCRSRSRCCREWIRRRLTRRRRSSSSSRRSRRSRLLGIRDIRALDFFLALEASNKLCMLRRDHNLPTHVLVLGPRAFVVL
eukprot:Amastigsp_a512697_38.p2 type:complete len:269 gc:universal Amastigsp_a512697_38:744-1550(+)